MVSERRSKQNGTAGTNDSTLLRGGKDKLKAERTFDVKITSAFATMREDLERTVRETNAYVDKTIDLLSQLEELHLRKLAGYQILTEHSHADKEKFDNLFSAYSSLLNELAARRTEEIRAGEEANQAQSTRMRRSRKEIMDAAKRRLDEGREKQQLAADASELMRHYKGLILAT